MRRRAFSFSFLISALAAGIASAQAPASETVRVYAAAVAKAPLTTIAADYENATGRKVELVLDTAGAAIQKFEADPQGTFLITTRSRIQDAEKAGSLRNGTSTLLGRTAAGVAVPPGSPKPDVSTPEKLKAALLAAKRVAFSDPSRGATVGTHFLKVIEGLGVKDEVLAKATLAEDGVATMRLVMEEGVDLGVSQSSEILQASRDAMAGPFPDPYALISEFSLWHRNTLSPAAREFARMLKRAAGREALAAGGIEPPSTGQYRIVDDWVQFPAGITEWGAATGVDVDAQDNIYVFHRNESMPIMVFDRGGKFLRGWGQGMFKTTHFLRVDASGSVWITDRGDMQAFQFDREGKLLLTLGKKGVTGDNTSTGAFNGMADVAVASNGDIFVADGEGPNTRVAKFARDGTFLKWWGGKGSEPGQFDQPHSIAVDSKDRIYVADRSNNRIQVFDASGEFLKQWTNFGTPWGLFIRGDRIYVVDGTDNNCLLIANLEDGRILDRIEGLSNPTAVAVDSQGAIYIGEVNGTNVKKLVRK